MLYLSLCGYINNAVFMLQFLMHVGLHRIYCSLGDQNSLTTVFYSGNNDGPCIEDDFLHC